MKQFAVDVPQIQLDGERLVFLRIRKIQQFEFQQFSQGNDFAGGNDQIRTFGFRQELLHLGPPPEKLFNAAIDGIMKIDAEGAIAASGAAYEIFTRAVNPLSGDTGSHDLAERFREIVAQNFSNGDFSLQDAANVLGVHRSTLHRVFTAKCGVSPQDYLCSYRMQHALELLASDMNIKEVADHCGFNAQHYFDKVFRDSFGKTPSEFRTMRGGSVGAASNSRPRRSRGKSQSDN